MTGRGHQNMWALFFLGPSLVLLVVFLVGPILSSLGLTLVEWDLLTRISHKEHRKGPSFLA